MFKPNSGRKKGSHVFKYFEYEKSSNKSRCIVEVQTETGAKELCGYQLKGKNASNLSHHLKKHPETLKELDEARKKTDTSNTAITTGCRRHLCTCITGI